MSFCHQGVASISNRSTSGQLIFCRFQRGAPPLRGRDIFLEVNAGALEGQELIVNFFRRCGVEGGAGSDSRSWGVCNCSALLQIGHLTTVWQRDL